jgi:HlyD family secretion protein
MNQKWYLIGIIGILSLSLLNGCSAKTSADPAAKSLAEPDAIAVNVKEAKTGVLSNANKMVGELAANTDISLFAKTSGTVVELNVKKGDTVTRGQVIGKLDQQDYVLGVKQAQAALGVADATLHQAQSGNRVDVAGSSYDLAKKSYDLAKAEYGRMQSLMAANAISKAQLDQAEAAFVQAKGQLNLAAKGDLQGDAAVGVAKAGVKQAQVGVERAQSTLDDTLIRATANGIITDVAIQEGDTVSPQKQVATLINLDPAIIKLNVPENSLAKFQKGTELQVIIPSLSLKTSGKVTYIGFEASSQAKMFPIELQVSNPKHILLAGMKAEITVNNLENRKGLLIPTEAIVDQEGKKFVYVIEGDKAVKRDVILSVGNTNLVMVESGVKEGEKVVVKGQSQLKDRAKIRILP